MGKRRAREIWEYDSMAEFEADGGIGVYKNGVVIIAGITCNINNGLIVSSSEHDYRSIGAIRDTGPIDSAALTNNTFQTNVLLPKKPYAIQFGFYGHDANVLAGCKAAFGFTSDATSTNGSALALSILNNITFNNSATFTLPSRVSSKSAVNTQLGLILSDVMMVPQDQLLNRNDGKSGYIIGTRIFQPAGNLTRSTITNSNTLSFDAAGDIKCGYVSSDAIAAPATALNASSIGAACILIVHYKDPVKSIFTIGDSTVMGFGVGTIHSAYGASRHFRRKMSDLGRPVNIINYSNTGQDSETYLANFMNSATNINAGTIAVFCPFSPNDNAGVLNQQIESFIVVKNINIFVSFCIEKKIKPVLLTPCPSNGFNADVESRRRYCVDIIKSIAKTNAVALIDRDEIYTNYLLEEGGYKSGFNQDTQHPNNYGYSVESDEWLRVIGQ